MYILGKSQHHLHRRAAGRERIRIGKLKNLASIKVKPPRVAASPVSFECRFLTSISFGPNQAIIAGQIVHVYVEDQFVLDRARGLIERKIEIIRRIAWREMVRKTFRPFWNGATNLGRIGSAR